GFSAVCSVRLILAIYHIQDKTGVITCNTVTTFDKKLLMLKIEASDFTITVILDKKRNVVRIDVKNRGKEYDQS
ncbi:hypothetical protein J1609_09740, partial [Leuconostoc mesenteroides]|nr:hypothetical protein [Leuconostoc mesenteroides]